MGNLFLNPEHRRALLLLYAIRASRPPQYGYSQDDKRREVCQGMHDIGRKKNRLDIV